MVRQRCIHRRLAQAAPFLNYILAMSGLEH